MTANLGRCTISGSNVDCTGRPDEEIVFAPLADDDEVVLVLGPQGSLMLVLAVRTSNMDPGDPNNPGSTENPEIDLRLYDTPAQQEVGRYRGRPSFSLGDDGVTVTAAGLFVVLDGNVDVVGHALEANVDIVDRADERRWGRVRLVAVE